MFTSNLLQARTPGHALEGPLYKDPVVFQEDMEAIFYHDWLFVAPSCEMPNPGSYVTYKLGEYQIVVLRGADGEIRAFHNSCRHRGSIICREAKGTAAKLVCPYHSWTYDLDGSLLWARDMGPDFDPGQHGLRSVHCRNLNGLVFICVADTPPCFDEFSQALLPYIAPHDLENAKVAHCSTIVENGNWKLVWENSRECYHCAANHPSLIRSFPEDPRVTFLGNGSVPPFIAQHFADCEAAGLPANYKVPADGHFRISRMPLVEGTKSFTMDGGFGVPTKRLGFVEKEDAGVCNVFHYPSTWSYFLPDHSMAFRLTPISPTETELVTYWLVHKDAVEGVDYDLKRLTEVWIDTNDEDRRVVEENQMGVNSPAYVPGPYSPEHEVAVCGFVDWYQEAMLERQAISPLAAE